MFGRVDIAGTVSAGNPFILNWNPFQLEICVKKGNI